MSIQIADCDENSVDNDLSQSCLKVWKWKLERYRCLCPGWAIECSRVPEAS